MAMENQISQSFISYLTCGIIEYYMKDGANIENKLKEIGYEVGLIMLEEYNFERENHLPTLLYRITYTLLNNIEETERRIEKIKEQENAYILTDYDGIFGRFISVPEEWKGFSADSIMCGIIEAAITASGYKVDVIAYSDPTDTHPNRVVFQIQFLSN